jgi:hypothetical protein
MRVPVKPSLETTMLTFAVLPFLKTRRPVAIGPLTFRSTDDGTDLDDEAAARLREIGSMLFFKDDLRIETGSYTTVAELDLDRPSEESLQRLADTQAMIAYIYASPHSSLGDLFLPSECASMTLLVPEKVSIFTARPTHHVVDLGAKLTPDARHQVDGYHGLRDFRHHFWSTAGSRMYGPLPQPTLNISQDLSADVERASISRRDYELLLELLHRAPTDASQRMFGAVRWFNKANLASNEDADSILDLSVAFEMLLRLPREEKTDRFKDTVSLLLGRLPRLDEWAEQFYRERSRIVHEGRTARLRFEVGNAKKSSQEYQSLVAYGRQIFQLCVGTLLQGLRMAEDAGIEEKLVTNQERFEKLCRLFDDTSIDARERLDRAKPTMSAIVRYGFVPESNLQLATILGACRRAVELAVEDSADLRSELRSRMSAFASEKSTPDHFAELQQLQALTNELTDADIQSNYISDDLPRLTLVLRLIRDVWLKVFMHYFWLKEKREANSSDVANKK